MKNRVSSFWIKDIYLIQKKKTRRWKAELEKEVEYNKVKWSKNVKGQHHQDLDNGDKKVQLPGPSRQSSKSTL